MQPEQKVVEIAGVPTRYQIAGSGAFLLLLHGLGDNLADWQWVLPHLADRYRVCALDLPGFSGLCGQLPSYALDFFTQYVLAFLTELEVDQAGLIGNSLGGLIALQLALVAPSRVGALVLADSAGLGRAIHPTLRALTTPGYGDLATAWASTAPGAAQRATFRRSLLFAQPARAPKDWFVEQYRLAQRPYVMSNALRTLRAHVSARGQRSVLLHQLPKVAPPTLIVWGEQDSVVPPSQAQQALQLLPKGDLVLVPACGHLPHVEQPERFVAAVRQFVRKSFA